jgi:hypothetical protein
MDGDTYDLDHDRAEATRRWQHRRLTNVAVAEMFLELARAHVKIRRDTRTAAGLLVKATEAFAAAGLSHRSRVAWRYCRMLHRSAWRAAR